MDRQNDKILLFIPMYNCEKQIVRVLAQLDRQILQYISEVILVNNRSTDNGEQAAVEYCRSHGYLPVKVLRNHENYGLGGSHKVAFRYAARHGFDYVIVLHGDDQGRIADFLPLLRSGRYREFDCCLGARFMKGSRRTGYSGIRTLGNYGFNLIFSAVVRRPVTDLGSGLNMYRVAALKSGYYRKYPDTLYFNDLMILASCHYKHKMLFYPVSWREEDQVSNNKLWGFSCALLGMLWHYAWEGEKYLKRDLRDKNIKKYTAQTVWNYRRQGDGR